MKNENSFQGKIPKSRDIYYYIIIGHLYFWLNKIKNGFKNIAHTNGGGNYFFNIEIINKSTAGDIRLNNEISKHMPSNKLTDKIYKSSLKGTPLVTLGDGSPPRVMITAGVHGNELSPQIAALKLINELENEIIQGTIYIIPFIAPKSSSKNIKLFEDENLNLTANIQGSPTNLVFETAKKKRINYLADFHTTSTDPAKTCIIYYPKVASSKIAVYINKSTNFPLLALAQHPGMLITLCNLYDIPSVICEVAATDGIATDKNIEESYIQMKAFLQYSSIL